MSIQCSHLHILLNSCHTPSTLHRLFFLILKLICVVVTSHLIDEETEAWLTMNGSGLPW